MENDLEKNKEGILFPKKKKLAIVLSGGAARALVHIGVLQVLEENNITTNAVIGTSMGAVIGGIYCSGNLKKFSEEITKMSESRAKAFLFSMKLKRINVDAMKSFGPLIKKYVGNKRIEDLKTDFTAIATDLKTGKEIYLRKGSLLKAILASISIPGIFRPLKYNNMLLVDGGVVDPLPIEFGRKIAKKVIVVNVNPIKFENKKKPGFFNVIMESTGLMSNTIVNLAKLLTLQNLEDEKLLFIQIDSEERKLFDFYNISELIEIGRKAAKKELKNIIDMARE